MIEVSVIIPSYNSARFVTAAIDSVLGQTYRDFEVLVIDNESSDDTESVMRRYSGQIRYIRQPNSGVAGSRNRGIAESRGRYVAFLDADDIWRKNKLERQLKALQRHGECHACYSAYSVADSNLKHLFEAHSKLQGPALEDLLLRGNVIGLPSTVVCEKSLFEWAGRFDYRLSYCADWEMWLRLAVLTEFAYVDAPLATYRRHRASMSRDVRLYEKDSLRVLDKGFSLAVLDDTLRSKRKQAFARNYMVLAGNYFRAGLYRDFLRCAALAISLDVHQAGRLLGFPARALKRWRLNDSDDQPILMH